MQQTISIIINADNRSENLNAEHMFGGCVHPDFLTHSVWNKIKFFNKFQIELILYIDQHNQLFAGDIEYLKPLCSTLVIRNHTDDPAFNDWNYWRALSMASGDIVVHFDQDTAAFTSSEDYVNELISYLDNHKIVSYPSHWSPHPTVDESFGGKYWASTRFFICKRDDLKLDELKKCIENPEWMYEKYGDSPRRCNWTEHYLAKINGNDVFYPPVQLHRGAIFTWKDYKPGTMKALNELDYELVKQWILHHGSINYPCDVSCAE